MILYSCELMQNSRVTESSTRIKKGIYSITLGLNRLQGLFFTGLQDFFFVCGGGMTNFIYICGMSICGIIIVCGGSILLDFVNTPGVCTVYLSLSVHSIN